MLKSQSLSRRKFIKQLTGTTIPLGVGPLSSLNFDDSVQHHINFFDSIRNGKPVVEDAVFGFRAAASALACNESYFKNKIVHRDPVQMKLKES